MALPGRAYFNIWEAGARWGCTPADILEWATLGHMAIISAIPSITAGALTIGGMVELHPAEVLPFFPRLGCDLGEFPVRRLRALVQGDEAPPDWTLLDQDAQILITRLNVLISSADATRFEQENGIGPGAARVSSGTHDWDGMWGMVVHRIYNNGVPESLQDLVLECEEWFRRRTSGAKVPDPSTIRKRLRPAYTELRQAEA